MGGGHFLRLVEEVKLRASSCQLQNEDVYMNTTFQDFIQMCVRKLRGEDSEEELVVDYVSTNTPTRHQRRRVSFIGFRPFVIGSGGEEHQQHERENASPAVHQWRICGRRGREDLQEHQPH